MAESYEYLRVEASEDRAVLTVLLNRSPVNAVSQQFYRELRDCFSSLAEGFPAAKLVVFRGSGSHFSAGNDKHEFATMTAGNASSRMREVREAFAAIYECPIPTLAVVTGAALGTGVAMVGCCDMVIAADDANFGTPEVGVGVMGGGRHLARLVGEARMRAMYFTAEPVSARELAAAGLIEAVPLNDLDEKVRERVALVTRHSSVVLRAAKQSLNRSEHLPLKVAYEVEQEFTVAVAATADSIEARRALAERRPPVYPGPIG